MGDLRLEVRVKNRALWEATVGKYGSAGHRGHGVSVWEPTVTAKRIADKVGATVGELFPPPLYEANIPALVIGEADSDRYVSLLDAPREALLLPSPDEAPPDETVIRDAVERACQGLARREMDVLGRRFGLQGRDEQTLGEVAEGEYRPGRAWCQVRHNPQRKVLTRDHYL